MARRTADPESETDTLDPLEKAIQDGYISVDDVPGGREEDATLAKAIERANDLLEQKRVLLGQIQEVRELSSLLVGTGIGSREQVAWVRFYLPRKKRGSGTSADDTGDAAE